MLAIESPLSNPSGGRASDAIAPTERVLFRFPAPRIATSNRQTDKVWTIPIPRHLQIFTSALEVISEILRKNTQNPAEQYSKTEHLVSFARIGNKNAKDCAQKSSVSIISDEDYPGTSCRLDKIQFEDRRYNRSMPRA